MSGNEHVKPLSGSRLAAHIGINAPHYKQSAFYNFSAEFEDLFEADVTHADAVGGAPSLLSPAAYLVDLDRLINQLVPDNDIARRRPDLAGVRLDQPSTEALVPFLDIVNGIIASRLAVLLGDSQANPATALKDLADSPHPSVRSFHAPLEQIRALIGARKTSLADVFALLQVEPGHVARERLGLSQGDYAHLLGIDDWRQLHIRQTPWETAPLVEVGTFLRETGLLAFNLGWSFTDLDAALCAVDAAYIDEAAMASLAKVKQVQEQLDLPIQAVISLWSPTSGTARTTALPMIVGRKRAEILKLLGSVDERQMSSVDDVLDAMATATWMRDARLTTAQVQTMISERAPAEFDDVARAAFTVTAMAMNPAQIAAVRDHPGWFDIDTARGTHWQTTESLRSLTAFKKLVADCAVGDDAVIDCCALRDEAFLNPEQRAADRDRLEQRREELRECNLNIPALSDEWDRVGARLERMNDDARLLFIALGSLLGRSPEMVEALALHSLFADFFRTEASAPRVIATMYTCFERADLMGVEIGSLLRLGSLADLDAVNGWTGYTEMADELLEAAKGQTAQRSNGASLDPLIDRLGERQRDALCATTIRMLRPELAKTDPARTMDSLQDLSEYLLVDVETGGCARTSHVKEAISCLQTYIERCRLNLESVTLGDRLPDSLWSWMGSYRLWEANRQVFLYPENFIEPSQRRRATPLFDELKNALLQGEVTDDSVTDAYLDYFDQLDALMQLTVIDAHYAKVTNPSTNVVDDRVFLIGRSSSNPADFFYRSAAKDPATGDYSGWLPWQRIDLTIPAEMVRAVYAQNRLSIVWLEQRTTRDRLEGAKGQWETTEATVRYSYLKMSGRWAKPQTHETELTELGDVRLEVWNPETRGADATFEVERSTVQGKRSLDSPFDCLDVTADQLVLSTIDYDTKNMVLNMTKVRTALLQPAVLSLVSTQLASAWYSETWSNIVADQRKGQADQLRLVHRLRHNLVNGGLAGLLSLESQRGYQVTPGLGDNGPIDFDRSNPYGAYLTEVFFHIPFLIADSLNGNRHFEQATTWYQHILDPTRPNSDPLLVGYGCQMWRYLPFRNHEIDQLDREMSDTANLDAMLVDSFDPHSIAATRLGVYEKALAMKYIDNLTDWADSLFELDTWEAINHAVILYVRVLHLLGRKPVAPVDPLPTHTVSTVDAVRIMPVHLPGEHLGDIMHAGLGAYDDPFFDVSTFFSLPENDNFAAYWDRALASLTKIRHCQNSAGIVRQLALFDPPIDPAQLVRRTAGSHDLGESLTAAAPVVPSYRFGVMLQQAKNLTLTVIQLGASLLSAIEKGDSEELNLLHSTQEQVLSRMIRAIKIAQRDQGLAHLTALTHSMKIASRRFDHFTDLLKGGTNLWEVANLLLEGVAMDIQSGSIPLKAAAIPGHLTPNVAGMAFGGMQFGEALMVSAQVVESVAATTQHGAAIAATMAQYARRAEDWQLQASLAAFDVDQIQLEINGAEIGQETLEYELNAHDRAAEHARQRDDFFHRKFTSLELYRWHSGQLSDLYFQTYRLAAELGRKAQIAYCFERHVEPEDAQFLDSLKWDSLRQGLLAGEWLMLGLNQLERAYFDISARELEIEKSISLLQLDPAELLRLRTEGACSIDVRERHFDADFPGHYCRRIKSISLTIPAVVGPNQNLNATLTQTKNRILLRPDPEAANTLLTGTKDDLDALEPGVLRTDWRPSQHIALSRGIDDCGTFQLDFRDDQYLPFEGTGAISTWELSMPKAANRNLDYSTIADVVMSMRYTALDGGNDLRQSVCKNEAISTFAGAWLFSMRQECGNEWTRFIARAAQAEDGSEQTLPFTVTPAMIKRSALNAEPGSFRVADDAAVSVHMAWTAGSLADSDEVRIEPLAIAGEGFSVYRKGLIATGLLPSPPPLNIPWTITATKATVTDLSDIVLIIPWRCDLNWS